MAVLTTGGLVLLCMAAAALLQTAAVRGLRVACLAHAPVSGEHTDTVVYHRSLWTPGLPAAQVLLLATLASGALAAMALQLEGWPWWPAPLLWLAAVAGDLWTWERVAGSVKFVSWRRGWRQSARRVAVSDLREVSLIDRPAAWPLLPGWAQPGGCYLVLLLRSGKAVKLPRTGTLFGGDRQVEDVANFVRLQMDVVADNRRRAIADKRAAARRAGAPLASLQRGGA